MDAIKAILERRSVRSISEGAVSKETLESLVECGRVAPSGHNKQGRSFLVLTERSAIDGVGNIATWGKFFIGKAPAVILVFCDTNECATPVEDGSAATENILIAATAQGLASCWVAGFGMPYASEIEAFAGAPENKKLISIIPIGYSAGANTPMPKKSPLNEVLFWNKF
ncbi:MAG: nitroreductase family protein [Solirubrobacterales bacterium]